MMIKTEYGIEYGEISEAGDIGAVLTKYSHLGAPIDPRFASINTTLSSLLMDRCKHSIAVYSSSSDASPETNEDVAGFLFHLGAVVNVTMTKYISLIASLNAKKDELLADVKSESTDRDWFNDTPQTPNPEGEALSHLTTFTKRTNETKSPMGTIATRLNEISTLLGNYWKDWTDEIISALHLED